MVMYIICKDCRTELGEMLSLQISVNLQKLKDSYLLNAVNNLLLILRVMLVIESIKNDKENYQVFS